MNSRAVLQNNAAGWCLVDGFQIDAMRRFLKARPDLQGIGRKVGPMTLFTREEWDEIATAFRARVDKRKRPATKGS